MIWINIADRKMMRDGGAGCPGPARHDAQETGAMDRISPHDAALRYLSYGWSVIPFRPRDKRPLVPWRRYQDEPPTRAQVDAWFTDHPDANVGIVTGAVSGLVVLDIDPAHGGDDSLAELERRYAPLPRTVEVLTGGGGRHVYFRHPGGTVQNKVGLAPGIDLRGDGGVVVAPPSIHPSGRRYEWEVSHHPDETRLAQLPAWLSRSAGGGSPPGGHPLRHWRALVREGVEEGERNSSLASLVGHLLWHGVDVEVVLELMLSWNRVRCRPPLSDEEVAAVVRNINRLHVQEQARRPRR